VARYWQLIFSPPARIRQRIFFVISTRKSFAFDRFDPSLQESIENQF
jgi:hypothetical protein